MGDDNIKQLHKVKYLGRVLTEEGNPQHAFKNARVYGTKKGNEAVLKKRAAKRTHSQIWKEIACS